MSRLEAIDQSVSEYYSLSSSGTILGECQQLSSSRSPGITHPQHVMVMTRMSSFSRVLVDRSSQLPFSTPDSTNCDMVMLSPSPLGVPATPTLSLSSSLTTKIRTTSRVMAIRRGNNPNRDESPETTSSSDAAPSVSSTTPAADAKGGNGGGGNGDSVKDNNATVKTKDSGTPLGHASTTATSDTYAWTATVTPFYTSSQQDAPSSLTTAIASTITSSTSISSGLVTGPQELVSQSSGVMVIITSEWTSGGYTYHTTLTLESSCSESVQPSPTGTVASVPSTSESSLLPLILGFIFGVVFLVAFAVIVHKFRARRRRQAELLPQPLIDHGDHNYQERLPRDPTPPVATPATLERRPCAPPLVGRISDWRSRCRSRADSSEPMSEVLSDPFADGSFAVSSRTSEPAPSNHFAAFGENLSVLHTSDHSELNILAPIPSNAGTYACFNLMLIIDHRLHYRDQTIVSPKQLMGVDAISC
ncbi:hypothetical protein P692DRAFT_20921084 [Suillus brevipes Sb2]|nr:hypothetical protein P692DRAFT_20921084 [Suillus brevipes Sb2]